MTEKHILSTIKHPFIVNLDCAFQNSQYLFLLMDFHPGGNLGEYLEEDEQFTESRA